MPGPFYHMNDANVYLGRQRGGGVPNQENIFCAHVLCLKQWVVSFPLSICSESKHLDRHYKD